MNVVVAVEDVMEALIHIVDTLQDLNMCKLGLQGHKMLVLAKLDKQFPDTSTNMIVL